MADQPYPFTTPIEVTFRDLDAMGHVNNAVYFTYMETARIKYMLRLLNLTSRLELPLIVAEATCRFKTPAFFGETLQIGVGIARFGTKSFDLAYQFAGGDGRLVALAKTVQVMYDYQAGRSILVPNSLKEAAQAFQGAWVLPAWG